jgi:ribosomal protein S18 acetylase RimI-like enzyme
VRPDLRRLGIGTALVRRVESALAALGCPKVNLQVLGSNAAAVVAFYERLGFAVEDRVSMGKCIGS